MKTSFLTCLLLSLSLTVCAQQKWPKKSYLAFGAGMAKPFGEFGSKDYTNTNAGLADNGLLVNAEFGSYLTRYFGVGASYTLRRNAVDVSEHPLYSGRNAIYIHTKWRSNFILINALAIYPVTGKLAVFGKLSGGASINTYPDQSYSTASSAKNKDLIKSEALAYGTAAGIKFLPGNVGLTFETSALFTEPVFKGSSLSARQAMNSLNYSLALNFKLK